MHIVYILKNKAGLFYKGVTQNLEARLASHNNGKQRWTRHRGPFALVYSEEYTVKSEALKREKFLKSGQDREWLKVLLNSKFGV